MILLVGDVVLFLVSKSLKGLGLICVIINKNNLWYVGYDYRKIDLRLR